MLTLRIKSGDYITIGDNVTVQIFERTGNNFEVSIKAPREIPVFRSDVYERSESRPEGLKEQRMKTPSEKRRDEKRLQALARIEQRKDAVEKINTLLDNIDMPKEKLAEMRRLLAWIQ